MKRNASKFFFKKKNMKNMMKGKASKRDERHGRFAIPTNQSFRVCEINLATLEVTMKKRCN